MSRTLIASALVALLCSTGLVSAQQSGTAAEAKAMLDRAVSALKVDRAAALSEFNDKSNTLFHDRDLYVFCLNMSDGKLTAHANPNLLGVDARALRFKDDLFGQRIYDAIKISSDGSVVSIQYSFPKPGATKSVPKESFATRIGEQGCGVGYYR